MKQITKQLVPDPFSVLAGISQRIHNIPVSNKDFPGFLLCLIQQQIADMEIAVHFHKVLSSDFLKNNILLSKTYFRLAMNNCRISLR